jgi:hypothetical protein
MCDDERFRGEHPEKSLYENDDFSQEELNRIGATLMLHD